jgi:hypothetical protein
MGLADHESRRRAQRVRSIGKYGSVRYWSMSSMSAADPAFTYSVILSDRRLADGIYPDTPSLTEGQT